MDSFINTVKSQTFKLTSFDAIVSHINASCVAFYRNNTADSANFPSDDDIKSGFYNALTQFPIMAGELIQRDDGGLEITVDKNNLNMPDMRISTADDIHYDMIQAANFNPSSWPQGLVTTDAVALADTQTNKIKLLHTHVVRFKENSGLAFYVSIAHVVGDASCCGAFTWVWADQIREQITGKPAGKIPLLFDRTVFEKCISSGRTPLDDLTQALLTQPNAEAESFARLPPNDRNMLIFGKLKSTSGHRSGMYRVNRAKLDTLVMKVNECVSGGVRVSVNDILIALIAKTLAQANRAIAGNTFSGSGDHSSNPGLQKIDFPCDVRQHLGVPINYMGNVLYQILTFSTIEQAESPTTPESIAEIATKSRSAIDAAKAPLISQLYDTLEADPTRFTRPMMAANMFEHTVTISNQSRSNLYMPDFGHGMPDMVIMNPEFQLGTINIMPARPPSKDLYIIFSESEQVFEQIRLNEAWASIIDTLF